MEQQIITSYKEKLKNMPNPLKGFNHFDSKAKKQVIICLATLIISSIISCFLLVKFPNKIYYFWFILIAASMDFLVIKIDDQNIKRNRKKFNNLKKRRISYLCKTLNEEIKNVNNEIIDILIDNYQRCINDDTFVQKLISSGFSFLSLMTTVINIFSNNMDSKTKVLLVIILLSSTIIFLTYIFLCKLFQKFFSITKDDYKMIINDLVLLKIMKYDLL